MKSITTKALRTIASVVAAGAALALVVVGLHVAEGDRDTLDVVSAATVDELAVAATETTDDDSGRAQLRADLKAARALTGEARKAALIEIRDGARAGEYGEAVQRRFDRRADRREIVRALLPAELKADLANLKAAPADQRDELRAEIMSKAVAGEYGEKVAAAAKRIQERWNS